MDRTRGAGRQAPACSGRSRTSSGGASRRRRRADRSPRRKENMKESDASQDQSASQLITKQIAELGDWRGKTLSRVRTLIKEADPDVVEEVKWAKPTKP